MEGPRDMLEPTTDRHRRDDAVRLTATVASGRGLASEVLPRHRTALEEAVGAPVHPGTLNLRLSRPLRIVGAAAWDGPVDGRSRRLAPARLAGYPVHVNHWTGCPQHRLDVVADVHLRRHLGLRDGDRVELTMAAEHVAAPTLRGRLHWLCSRALDLAPVSPAARALRRLVARLR
jgi:CTP-dependent riboflavin kinase